MKNIALKIRTSVIYKQKFNNVHSLSEDKRLKAEAQHPKNINWFSLNNFVGLTGVA